LSFWDEIVGIFEGVSVDEDFTYITINDKLLAFHKDSNEGRHVTKRLANVKLGSRIAILRTDSIETPLLVRFIPRKGSR